MHRALFALALLSLACSGSAPKPTGRPRWTRPVMAPDGSQAHVVVCSNRISRCYSHAQWVCPDGYDMLDRTGRVDVGRGVAYSSRGPFGASVTSYHQGQRTVHELLIKCTGRSYMDSEGEATPELGLLLTDEDCLASEYCRQLGRCRARHGKCVR